VTILAFRTLHIFAVVCLTASACNMVAQDNYRNNQSEKSPQPIGNEASPGSEMVENWAVLDDIKTGLHPRVPFEVQKEEDERFTRELIRLQWRNSDPIDLWVMRPKTLAKVPVVLYLYSYPADTDRFRDNGWCQRATENGFAAVGFVSALTGHRYSFRPMKEWFVSQLQESLGSTTHDVQLILNYLVTREDMDMEHVGMVGMGSGGVIAVLAAQADSRIQAIDLMDPWGDWPDWLRGSPAVPENERSRYVTEDFLKSVAQLDPVLYLPGLKTPSIRLQQITNDPVTPEKAKEKIAASVPARTIVAQYANAIEHMKAWQVEGMSAWIKKQLKGDGARAAN